MVKLSSTICIGKTISNTWIHLLHKYFEDLLLQPISGSKLNHDGFLEGSPFCTSIFDPEKHNIPSFHLQRLAILLYLKCSLNLVSTGSPDEQKHMHENLKQYSSSDLNLDSVTELYKWLRSHVPADILLKDELYYERCVRFTSSFIQLFMHEVCSHAPIASTELLLNSFLCLLVFVSIHPQTTYSLWLLMPCVYMYLLPNHIHFLV